MKKTMRTLFAAAAAVVLGACSAEKDQQQSIDPNLYFQKVTTKMSLEHGLVHQYYTLGAPNQPAMRFQLRNQDVSPASVNEWYMNETDNIRLYYAFCEPGKSGEIPEDAWQLAWPDVQPGEKIGQPAHPRRSGLILQPNNAAVIDVPLTFLEHAKLPDALKGKGRDRYTIALCAQIALSSLQTKSDVFEITVHPQTKDVEIK